MKLKNGKYPAFKLLLLVLLFFVASSQIEINNNFLPVILMVCFGISLSLSFFKQFSVAFIIGAAGIGIWIASGLESASPEIPKKVIPEMRGTVHGKVVKVLKSGDTYKRVVVKGTIDTRPMPSLDNAGIILTIFKKGKNLPDLVPGVNIYANAKIRPPREAQLETDFSEKSYAAAMNAQWLGRASAAEMAITHPPGGFLYFRHKIIEIIRGMADRLYPESVKGIVLAITTGDKTEIPPQQRRNFSLAGTAHLLAVSGLHTGIIAAIIFLLLSFVRNRCIKLIIFTFAIAAFVIMTGMQPSTVRAGSMAVLFMLIYVLQRHPNILNILSFVTIFVLIIQPRMILSAGFQMSVISVFGIALLYNPIKNFFKRLKFEGKALIEYLRNSVSVSIAASIAVTPLVAYYFGVVSLISPVANIFVIPLMSLGMIFSFISYLTFMILPGLGQIYANSAALMIEASQWINEVASGIPYAFIEGSASFYYALLISAISAYIFTSGNLKNTAFRTAVSAIFVFIFLTSILALVNKREMQVYPRDHMTVIEVPVSNNTKFFMLSERKPEQYPILDYSLLKYLELLEDSLIIGVSGNCGIAVTDKLKESKDFRAIEFTVEEQNSLAKKLHLDKFPQIIEINNYE